MNNKIISIKKSFLNVCNKFKSSSIANRNESATQSPSAPVVAASNSKNKLIKDNPIKSKNLYVNKYKSRRTLRKMNNNSNDTFFAKSIPAVATNSSGYGTSVESVLSVFVNLDNYFYDENFAKIKDQAQENVKSMKTDAVQYLLDYQVKYIDLLKTGLENYIRPLSALMESSLFFETFQNIEKIFAMSEFIRHSINDSMQLTMDIYTSTITVIHEFISVICSTYETYLKGYAQSETLINDVQFNEYFQTLNNNDFLNEFDLAEFIDLPIKNLTKIYCAFMSLLEMTPSSQLHDYERICSVCRQIKSLIGPSSDMSLGSELNAVQIDMQSDYIDMDSILNENSIKKNQFLTSKDLRYNYESSMSDKSSIQMAKKVYKKRSSKKSNRSSVSSKRLSLPKDYTDKDGNKYYFI